MSTLQQQSIPVGEGAVLQPINELSRAQWQLRLLPFMTWFVAMVSIVLLAVSVVDMVLVRRSIEPPDATNISRFMEQTLPGKDTALSPDKQTERSLLLLEADALDKRYRQASALLMSRIWTKHLAFITGEIMALLGAVFILGKLKESPSKIGGSSEGWRVDIASASPGIVLACLGTVLLIVAVTSQAQISVTDRPVYVVPYVVQGMGKPAAGSTTISPPNTEIIKDLSVKH
jgi:hypothetical protein